MTKNKGDLISREALKKSFEDTVCIEPMPYAFVKQIINNAPTVEERPQGEWRSRKQGDIPITDRCTNCNYEMKWYKNKHNFCPNCGARMGVKKNEMS